MSFIIEFYDQPLSLSLVSRLPLCLFRQKASEITNQSPFDVIKQGFIMLKASRLIVSALFDAPNIFFTVEMASRFRNSSNFDALTLSPVLPGTNTKHHYQEPFPRAIARTSA